MRTQAEEVRMGITAAGSRRPRILTVLLLALVTVIVFGLCAACGNVGPTNSSDSALRVGFVGVGSTEGSHQASLEKKAVAALRAQGMSVDYRVPASLDPQQQVIEANALLSEGISILVASVHSTNLWTDTMRSFRADGIPVLLLGRKPVSVKADVYDAYLGPSFVSVGKKLGAWVSARAEALRHAKVLRLEAPLDSQTSSDITDGWKQSLASSVPSLSSDVLVATAHEKTTRTKFSHYLDEASHLPEVVVAYTAVAARAVEVELAARGIETAQEPSSGKVCVLAAGAEQENFGDNLAARVTWDGDMSEQLARLITQVQTSTTRVKDHLVTVNGAESKNRHPESKENK
jgi:hypothetical protein